MSDEIDPLGASQSAHAPTSARCWTSCSLCSSSARATCPRTATPPSCCSAPQDKLLKKIGEEATEVVMAAKDADSKQLRYEIGDLIYHLLVVMVREGLTLDDLAAELAERRRK